MASVVRCRWSKLIRGGGMAMTLCTASPALAGPPFFSDDPEPTDYRHWEIYGFVAGTNLAEGTGGQTGFDINYGGAKDLQLTAVVPLDYQRGPGTDVALGDLELAAKYRFLHQRPGSAMPDVAFFPRVFVPTAPRRFGTGRIGVLLPIWAQKDIGKWALFGGGGYVINPGSGQRNYSLAGLGLLRQITGRLQLGVEAYHYTRDAVDSRNYTAIGAGALYRLSKRYSVVASIGPGIQHAREQGRSNFYLALKADL